MDTAFKEWAIRVDAWRRRQQILCQSWVEPHPEVVTTGARPRLDQPTCDDHLNQFPAALNPVAA